MYDLKRKVDLMSQQRVNVVKNYKYLSYRKMSNKTQ